MTAATLSVLLLLVAGVYTVTAQGRGGAPGALRPQVVDVGVILDRKTWVGNISWTCIELAMEDFYASPRHAGYSTRLKLHLRDTGLDAVSAAAAGVDLLKNVGVRAFVGPQTATQAKFLAHLGNKSSVPIISFSADCPSRSGLTPYFIRTAWNDSSQAEAIAALVQRYNWREVIPVFEDDDSNIKFIPDLVDALRQVDTRVSYRCKILPLDKEDDIKRAISSLRDHWTSVFIVRMSNTLALKFFQLAKDEGMMGEGFVWITAYGLTDIFDVVGSPALDLMQGVLGVKPHVQDTMELQNFRQRWRKKYRSENPGTSLTEPTLFGLYAYDTIWALALAAEVAGFVNSDFGLPVNNGSTDFDRIDTSRSAKKLRDSMLKVNFSGMSGKFQIKGMQLASVNYTIINIVGRKGRVVGFWNPVSGISSSLWPGDSDTRPRGWILPWNKTLKIGVPVKGGFGEFVRFEGELLPKGFCINVFEEVVADLPYKLPCSYLPFEDRIGESNGTIDELVYKVYLKEFDAVIGDVTILVNRSLYADFTLPYTESGVRMLVPVLDRRKKTAWTFLKPLKTDLWLGTGAFVVFTGFVVWCIERNEQFKGHPASQIGSVFYFIFSTLVFAHREGMVHNLSRIVVIVWLFVVLILQQSYTASLSSILTVEQLQPTVTSLEEVISKGSHVGYLNGSFLPELLRSLKIDDSKMIAFDSPEEYNEALSTGKVAVIVDEIPYLKAFPRGSPLTPDISRGILKLESNGRMVELQKALYGDKSCPDKDNFQTSSSLTLRSFQGLFIISGACSVLALTLHAVRTIYSSPHGSSSASTQSLWRRWLAILSKVFHKGGSPSTTPDNGEPTTPIDSTGDTGSPPEGEHADAGPLSSPPMRGYSGRHILSTNWSSMRRRQIQSCNEIHGDFIAEPEVDRSL
ncbi:glutamate receptor 2.9 isoform X2 [Lolium perenne]|uniref:glutamate receptor 2.9 isoform X2 n=1 Tax=Lolium perenne TaxID=4522 RepID=UPI0021F581B3|nr:glutamate receptor 2.9-like isoform X2 [Lolium perenne]